MKTFLLLLSIVLIQGSCWAPESSEEQRVKTLQEEIFKEKNKALFTRAIEHIKKQEGLRLKVYKCPAGQKTIGYGHMILPHENYEFISKHEADSLLISDFNKRLNLLDKELAYHKKLSLACFIYNVGFSTYQKSTLRQLVEKNLPIDLEIVKYSQYKVKDCYVYSKHLLKARIFELNMYKM